MKKVLPFLVVLALIFGESASFDARWLEKAIFSHAPAPTSTSTTADPLATCSITISKITVSGCYLVNGLSKATVTAEISWLEAPTNGTVTVSIAPSSGTATPTSRTFKPGANTFNYGGTNTGSQTIVSPQVIAFEIDANAAAGTITAAFDGSCTTTGNYTAPAACPATPCNANGIGGIVFNDYNGNGVRETALATVGGIQVESGETDGLAGVKVRVTDAAGNTFTTTTDTYGTYAISQSITYPARVEFSGIPSEYNGSSTLNGSSSRTTVQFVSAANCNVNLGVNRPTDYCDTSPQMFTPCYVNGHPLGGGTSGPDATLVSVPFNNIGKGFTTTTTSAANRYWGINSQTGSVWGLAYNRYTKKMFSASLLRRHTGFGPLGIGGIYVTDMTQSTPTNNTTHTSSFIDLDAAPFNVNLTATYTTGTNASQANNGRDLPAAKNSPSRDANAFILTGKDGLGDLDISENGDTLFAVNLHEKTLLVLNISAFNQDGVTKPTSVTSLAIPNPGCTNGEWRPWALKYYRGKLYVGGVCDGSNTSASAEVRKGSMRAYVYVYENGSFSPTPIMDFPLTYPRGYADANIITAAGWFPWTDSWSDYLKGSGTNYNVALPQPIFADIEFDTDGSMLIGLADRTGFQTGIQNYMPTGTATTIHSGFSGGDILKAYARNGVFILENNGKAGPYQGYGPGNNQGPGFGEYFDDNWYVNANGTGNPSHTETVLGGLAIRPGSGQTVAVSMDPRDGVYWSGGFRLLNNNTGRLDDSYAIYSSNGIGTGTLGKAAGLGDVELTCALPVYLELGNRVWIDANGNGVQDPGQGVVPQVPVALYKTSDGTLVARDTTDANGEYYFSTSRGDALTPSTNYTIVFGQGVFADHKITVGGRSYLLTLANTGEGDQPDLNDSDVDPTTYSTALGAIPAGLPYILAATGAQASVNHTFDMGLIPCPILKHIPNQTICAKGELNNLCALDSLGAKPTFQWYANNGAANPGTAAISGQTEACFTALPTAPGVYSYRVVATATNGLHSCDNATTVTLTILETPVVQVLPAAQVLCAAEPATAFTVSATPTTGLEYQWYGPLADTTSGLGNALGSATSDSFTPSVLPTSGTEYYAVVVKTVANGIACSDTTFVKLTVSEKPQIADGSATLCEGERVDLTSLIANYGTYLNPTWTSGSVDGEAVGNPASVGPIANTTYYLVAQNASTCSDTAQVVVTVNPKPSLSLAGQPTCAADLLTYSVTFTAPAQATITTSTGTLSGNTVSGISSGSQLMLIAELNGCKDTLYVTHSCTCPPVAAPTLAATSATLCAGESTTLSASGCSGTVTFYTNEALSQVLTGLTVSPTTTTTYYATCTNTVSGCVSPSAELTVTVHPKPQIADAATVLCAGESVDLTSLIPNYGTYSNPKWTAGSVAGQAVASPTSVSPTSNTTYYLVAENANSCSDTAQVVVTVTPKPTIGTVSVTGITCNGQPNDDASFQGTGITNADKYTYATSLAGLANYASATALAGGTFSVTNLPNPDGPGGATYYLRIFNGENCYQDTTLLIPYCGEVCYKPNAGADQFICHPTSSINLPDAGANQTWITGAQNPAGVTIDAQTGAVAGLATNGIYTFILLDTQVGTCADTVYVFRGILSLASQNSCTDTLSLPKVPGASWSVAPGNTASITPEGYITGLVAKGSTYTFIISNNDCSDTVTVTRLNCDPAFDLALDKAVSTRLAMLGDTITYTVRVWNEGEATAHGIVVTDTLNAGVQYLSSTASVGTYTTATGQWAFDSLAVGDTVALQIRVRIVKQGVWFNTAEITHMDEDDEDSTPGNGEEGEDDIDRTCFTVPVMICRGQGVQVLLEVPAPYTGVVWFRKAQGGQPVQVSTGNQFTVSESELGTFEYTYTTTQGTCPQEGCCPTIVVVEDCCPEAVCVPFVIQKTKKSPVSSR